MWKIGSLYGLLLIALGLYGFMTAEVPHWTALIPAFFGGIIFLLSLFARKDSLRKHMMHGIVLLALIGLLGSVRGLTMLPAALSGQPVDRLPMMIYSQSIMAILSVVFIVLAVRSFIAARRARTAA